MVASKRFTIHEPPVALTIHLKRFSPLGRKIGHPVRYEERLSLAQAVSEGQYGPSYSLYGVISHAGGGPHSGHYYAHVRASNDQWYEMNDDSVTRYPGLPTGMKNAYILFYMRDRGQALQAAVTSRSQWRATTPNGIKNNIKKRKISDQDADAVDKPKQPFIGPLLPPSVVPKPVPSASPTHDPQADLLKRKIEAVSKPTPKISNALLSLSQYADEDDDVEDIGEKVEAPTPAPKAIIPNPPTSSEPSSVPSIPTDIFYGSSPPVQGPKRKLQDDEASSQRLPLVRRFKTPGSVTMHRTFGSVNPYNRTSGVKNAMRGRYGKKKRSTAI